MSLSLVTHLLHLFLCCAHRIMHTTTSDIRSICRIIPGLSRVQLNLCYKANDVTIAALDGLDLAMRECQLQVIITGLDFIEIRTAPSKMFSTHSENASERFWSHENIVTIHESWFCIHLVFSCSFSGIVGIVHRSIQRSVIHTHRIYWKKVRLTSTDGFH